MAVSINSIPRGDENGLTKINTNFSALKTVAETLQGQTPTVRWSTDYTVLNGITSAISKYPILFLTFPNFQIMTISIFLNNINIEKAWTGKDVISVPKGYIKHSKANIIDTLPASAYQTPFDLNFNPSTGIINLYNRNNKLTGNMVKAIVVLYD